MPGLVPGIHAFTGCETQGVGGRNKSGHDGGGVRRRHRFMAGIVQQTPSRIILSVMPAEAGIQ
jgi:hypothetical protein